MFPIRKPWITKGNNGKTWRSDKIKKAFVNFDLGIAFPS